MTEWVQRMRRTAVIAVAAATALVLASCVTIPSSGGVITGQEVSEQAAGPGFVSIPEGPVADADQESILSGFIAAFSGSGNYEVARQFLSEDLAEEWDPRESVLIRAENTSARIDRVGENALAYDIVVSAAVDRDGSYTSFAAAPQTLSFGFVQEEGQWRISAAPDGIVLLNQTFIALFSSHALYFLDPTRQSLVPDLRWFPNGAAATRIAIALLNGPPPWLGGAVGTAFPDGTQLSSPRRVAIDDDVAVVDLTEEALVANREQRQLMRVQLEASFGKLASISSVELAVAGTALTIPPIGSNAPQLRPQVDSRMLVLRDDEFGYLANDRIAPIDGLSNKVVDLAPTEATLASSGTSAAVLGEGGVFLVSTGADQAAPIDSRPGLIAPTFDGYGYIWTAQRSNSASIHAFDRNGEEFEVQTTLPSGAEIVSLEVSRDGARVAVLLATNAGPRLMVAAIIRDPNRGQVPVSLGEPRIDVITDSGTAIDATWVDELSVATLTRDGSATTVTLHQIGGRSSDLGNPGNAVAIVGGNSVTGLRVLGDDGVISVRRGSGWQKGPTVSFIATQR